MSAKLLGNSGVLYTDRRDFYISPYVTKMLWTDVAPFTTLISNRATEQPADPLFKMFEYRAHWIKQVFQVTSVATLTAVADTASGAITVKNGTVFGLPNTTNNPNFDNSVLGYECEIWNSAQTTRKGVVVITAQGGTTVTVKVLYSVTGADFALANDDYFFVVGAAHGEASSAPDGWADELSIVYSSTQYFRTALEISGKLLKAALRGEVSELARLRDAKMKEHKILKERAFLFGGSPIGTGMDGTAFADSIKTDANGYKIRSTTGLITALEKYGATSGDAQAKFTITAASYTYSNFVDDMEKVFNLIPSGTERYAFCGPGAMSYWSKLSSGASMTGQSGWSVQLGATVRDTLGFNIRVLETPHGILKLVPTPVLRGPYNKTMLLVSDANLKHVQYEPMTYHANIKTDNNPNLVKDEITSDEGIGVTLLETHKLFNIV